MSDTEMVEPTLGDLVRGMWSARLSLLTGAATGLLVSLVFIACAVPHYRVSMLVAPAERMAVSGSGIAAAAEGFKDDPPTRASEKDAAEAAEDYLRFEKTLLGPRVAEKLMGDDRIQRAMARNGQFVFSPLAPDGTVAELSELLRKQVAVAPVGDSVLRRVSFDARDPAFGTYLLGRLYTEGDALIRKDAGKQAQERTEYLSGLLEKTEDPDHRRALTALLVAQERARMLLGSGEPYAAMIAEPPAVSARPVWPRKALIIPALMLAGALLGFALRGSGRGA